MTKRILAWVLVLITLLSASLNDGLVTAKAETTAEATGQELIANGGFEEDTDSNGIPDGWTNYKGDWTSHLGVEYLESAATKAVKMSPGNGQNEPGIQQQNIAVDENTTYKLNVRIYSTVLNAYANYKIFFYNAAGETISTMGTSMEGFWNDTELGTWKDCSTVEIVTPEGCTSLTVVLYAKGATLYFDNVSLVGPAPVSGNICEHTGETEIRDAKEATVSEEGYTGDTYCLACNTKIATGKAIDKLQELIANGGFEEDTDSNGIPDGWTNYKGDWTSHLGVEYLESAATKAVKMSPGNGQSEPGIQQQNIAVNENTTYKLNVKIYSTVLNAYANYKIFFYNAAGETITSATMGASMEGFWKDTELGTWKDCPTVEIVTPEGCTSLTVALYAKGATLYFDNVSLGGPAPASSSICEHAVGETGTAATCTTKAVCGTCGEYFGELDPTNHGTNETEIRDQKPATETEVGYTGDTYCKGCKQLLKKGVEASELLRNPALETFYGNKPAEWTVAGGASGAPEATIVHDSSTTSLKLTDNGENYSYITQSVMLVAGTPYTASAYVYPEDMGEGAFAIKLEYYGKDEYGLSKYLGKWEVNFTRFDANKWNYISTQFTPPEGTEYANVMFRLNKGKVAYFDDLSLAGEKPPVKPPQASEDYKALSDLPDDLDSKELLTNTGFEIKNSEGTYADGWERIKADEQGNQYITIIDKNPLEGDGAIRINSTTNNNPWLRQELYGDFKKGEVYQLSAWVRKATSGTFGFKLEYYDADKKQVANGTNSDYVSDVTGEQWVQYVRTMTIPEDCKNVTFYFRMFSTGVTDVDNVSFYKIKDPDKITIDTDEIFYYEEEALAGGWGTAEALLYTDTHPELEGTTVTFRLKYGEELITESAGHSVTDNIASFDFRLSLMEKISLREYEDTAQTKLKWEEYTMEAAAVKDNKEIAVSSRPIYVCPRPTFMNDEGRIELDGEIFDPVFFYHVNLDQYDAVATLGANVVQSRYESYSGIKSCLDEAAKTEEKTGTDLKVMAALYRDMKPAGELSNQANTTEIIAKLKGSDDLLGYMVMDEPSSNWAQRLDVFEDSYKLIRSLDPDRPVYMVEANPAWYDTFNKYVDILGIDPYLQSDKKYEVEHVRDYAEKAIAATKHQKPVWCITQLEKLGTYLPDENGIRNMFYQGLMGGSAMIGYFPYYGCYKENGTLIDLDDTGNDVYLKKLYVDSNEAKDAYNHFVDRDYPIFAEKNLGSDAYWYSSYVKDGILYMITVNNSDTAAVCNIQLTSDGGKVSVDAFTAEKIYGDTDATTVAGDIVTGNGVLSFTLEGDGAYVWKITPSSETVDFSAINTTKYRDTYLTPWGAEEIRELEAEKIANDWTGTSYAAKTLITRADFAYMYVNALGLTAETTGNFADVETDAYYAEAVAIGKALGIFVGDSNNNFSPEALLSRQDMMAIIARGLGESTDISGQTRNAKGSTTRAEVAVIINRLMDMDK